MADTFTNICSVGQQAGSVGGPVQRSTKAEQFYGKMKVFNDQIRRIIDHDERMPSGTDVSNVLKYFQHTLLGWIKESQNYFDEDSRQFSRLEHPSVDYDVLCAMLLQSLKEAKEIAVEKQVYVEAILTTLACLVPFLSHNELLGLPTKISSAIKGIPISCHPKAVSLICGYLLPLLLGAVPTDGSKERSKVSLSSPGLLLTIFQSCTDQSLFLRIVETLMAYKKNVCGDLLYVMAYGTQEVLEPAIHMLNRYFPAVEIGTVMEYRSVKEDELVLQRCENQSCAENNSEGFIRTAELVCLDPSICSSVLGCSPPIFLCTSCAELLNSKCSSLFVEVVRSIGNISDLCENQDCQSKPKAGKHFCFSSECTRRNKRKPMRICNTCNESLHAKGSPFEDHTVHSSLTNLWSMTKPTQTYLLDTVSRLLKQVHPPFGQRCVEMGIDLETISSLTLSDKRDANYYKKITRSLHGLSLLKALSPIPPTIYSYEQINRLLSMLFAWLETVASKAHIHVKIVEIVERYQAQAIEWIQKVESYDFHLYCDCLLPVPPVEARIGLAWESLMSENRQLLEGLQRISTLAKFGLLPEKVWERVLPDWIQEIKEKVSPDELIKYKAILKRLFDIKSEVRPSYSLNFIDRKLQNISNSQRQESLAWLQVLSAVDVCLDVGTLISMFIDAAKQAERSEDEETQTMFQFPDPQSYSDVPLSPARSSTSPGSSPFVFPSVSVLDSGVTYYILMMDILIKQISLRKTSNSIQLNTQESFSLAKLLVSIVHNQKDAQRCLHSGQTACQYCQLKGIFYYQITILLDFVLPTYTDVELKSKIDKTSKSVRSESLKSSIRSHVSSNASFAETRSVQRTESADSDQDFDEAAASFTGYVSSAGVDESDSELSAIASVTSEDSEQDSLIAWRNKIKGISEGSILYSRGNSIGAEQSNWSLIYRDNPDIEITVLLLQHLLKHTDPIVLGHVLKCISMTCIRGECLRVSAREDMDLTHYLQTVLFIPSLWEMLQSNNSCLAQQAVPLLLHCICMPYGAARLCDEIESVFNNEDWIKRFSAVEKVSLLCDFIDVDRIRDSSLAKSTLVHALIYLISAIDDVNDAVATKARALVASINRSSLLHLYCYMEEHFRDESEDRLALLYSWRTLSLIVEDSSPFSAKFFTSLLVYVITKAKTSAVSSSRGSSFSSTVSDEMFLANSHMPMWSRALSSPGRATGIANWVSSGSMVPNRPRSASAPFVLYKQKFTLQFDRQSSLLSQMMDEATAEDESTNSRRRRRQWSPTNDPFSRGHQDPSLTNGYGETFREEDEEGGTRKRKESAESSGTSSSKSSYLQQIDNVVLHYLVTLSMEHFSNAKAVNQQTCSVEDISEFKTMIVRCLIVLTAASDDQEPVFKASELRSCPVFMALMMNVTAVLDSNPYAGKELLPFVLNLMRRCIADPNNESSPPDTQLDVLDPLLQHCWLMNLIITLYKYKFGELKSALMPLISFVINTINSHEHYLCIEARRVDLNVKRDGNKSFPRRVRPRKGSRAPFGTAKMRMKLGKISSPKVFEEENTKNMNEDQVEMTRLDSKIDAKRAETSFVESSSSGSPMSQEGPMTIGDSESTSLCGEELTLMDIVNSQKCPDCQSCVRDYDQETVNLCIVVLSTFIHRDPEMAAPLLMEMLGVVSRKILANGTSFIDACNSHKPRSAASLAKQFIRCVFVQLSPNGLFPELIRCDIFDEDFFKAITASLLGFDKLDEMKPLKSILQDFPSRSNREDRVGILLQNLNVYLQFVPKDDLIAWEHLLHDFEGFFKALLPVLPAPFEASSLLQIMKCLLSIGKHYAKGLLPSFGNVLSHVVRKCDFKIDVLQTLCLACKCAFSKEREKHFLARSILQDLSLTLKNKISMHERNAKKIMQLIYLEGDSWFSFEHGDSEIRRSIGKQDIGMITCIQSYQPELFDCIKHWDYRIKDIKEFDEDSIDENYFPVQLKASLSQIIAMFLKRDKSAKVSQRILSWLRNPPSQLGRVELILDSVANLRFLSWLLLGAINHVVDHPMAHDIFHVISLSENGSLTDYIKIVLQSILRYDNEKNFRLLRPALYVIFITCQLWTIYCECHLIFHMNPESDPLSNIMEFWTQVTFCMVQLLSANDKLMLDMLLPFLKITDGVASCAGYSFPRLSTLWCPLVQYYKNEIPEDVFLRFKQLQTSRVKSEDPKNELQDLVRYTRTRLAKLEKTGNKFDHAVVV
ncbi:protein unc-79 homolog [Rhopilema esculentum]|uniref:protein unc-79 homolog n=1 Tax=Rhopilema esculentum TaxID=499914 RepID=UPI0031D1BD83